MEKTQYIINEMNQLHHLAIRKVDSDGHLIERPYDEFESIDPIMSDPSLLYDIKEVIQKAQEKYVIYQEDDYVYSIFCSNKNYIILGPNTVKDKNEEQKKDYLRQHNVENEKLVIPHMNLIYFKKLTAFVYGLIAEDYECSENLLWKTPKQDNQVHHKVQEEIHQELTEYVLTTAEEEQIHFSFEEEKKQAEHIIHGGYGGNIHNEDDANIYSKKFIGKMAKTPVKQVEYECVCWITLMTRYAIEAGVSDAKSYALSDVTLQKLSVAKTTVEMRQIFDSSMKEFDTLIQDAKAMKGKTSPYIDRCKDYIAKHIYEKITLEEIADEVGLHPVYLSRLFTQYIGVSITHFIMEEKIKLACNLLKYSGNSIAAIAEYMNLAPQSYFSRVFKKIMSQSPGQYRREHMDKKFYES